MTGLQISPAYTRRDRRPLGSLSLVIQRLTCDNGAPGFGLAVEAAYPVSLAQEIRLLNEYH